MIFPLLGAILLAAPWSAFADDSLPDLSHPLATADTSSPRATLRSYQTLMGMMARAWSRQVSSIGGESERTVAELFEIAERCFDLSDIPSESVEDVAETAIVSLQDVLDRLELPLFDLIPDAEQVAEQDLQRWTLPNTEISIVRISEGTRQGEWLFSRETVARLSEFRAKMADSPLRADAVTREVGPLGSLFTYYQVSPEPDAHFLPPDLVRSLPSWARQVYWGQSLWKWLGALLLSALSLAAFLLVQRMTRARAQQLRSSPVRRNLLLLVPPIAALTIALALDYLLDEEISLSGNVIAYLETLFWALALIALAWAIFVAGNVAFEIAIRARSEDRQPVDESLIRISSRIVSALLALWVLIVGAERFGISIVPLLAGLGVGGLAVALAVRPTLENVIGGFTLFGDRPVRPGDVCRFGERLGRVESIGLRSTRVRTLDDTVVTIPNAEFSQMQLENVSNRSRTLLDALVGLRYETTPDQLRYVLATIRRMLVAHPRVATDDMRVRFAGFGDYSLDVEIVAYVRTNDWAEFCAIREDINLRLMEIVGESGTGFAFPSQTNYLVRDAAPDSEKRSQREAEVAAWRDADNLPFPELDVSEYADLEDSLDYPPVGSPDNPVR